MNAYIVKTGFINYPYALGRFTYGGDFGYMIYGDSLENCIKYAQENGYKIENLNEVQS